MKIEFKIREIKLTRRSRGVEWIRVDIFEDGKKTDWIWMNEYHIKMNKKDHGEDCFLNDLEEFLK